MLQFLHWTGDYQIQYNRYLCHKEEFSSWVVAERENYSRTWAQRSIWTVYDWTLVRLIGFPALYHIIVLFGCNAPFVHQMSGFPRSFLVIKPPSNDSSEIIIVRLHSLTLAHALFWMASIYTLMITVTGLCSVLCCFQVFSWKDQSNKDRVCL